MKKLFTATRKIPVAHIGDAILPKPAKRTLQTFLIMLGTFIMFSGNSLRAQTAAGPGTPNDPPADDDCPQSCLGGTYNISTGFNQSTATYGSPVSVETNWTLVSGPPSAGLGPNPPCFIIPPNGAWASFPQAKWISPFQFNNYTTNNCPPQPPFIFKKCFCVCKATNLTFNFELLVDDGAVIKLDGVTIATAMSGYQFQWANRLIFNQTIPVTQGQHCLTVELHNCGAVAMGFALQGTITGFDLLKPICCTPEGSICGTKIKDQNCDGQVNPWTDPGLSGWTIELRDALNNIIATTVTDANGNYCFTGLAAGNYFVTEVNQPGWVQTFPAAPGSHNINLAAGNTVTANFGNCQQTIPGVICGTKYWDQNCNGHIDANDTPMGGWTIELRDAFNNLIASTVTTPSGSYCFNNLPAGTYVVNEVNQPGWTQTFPAPPGTHTLNVNGNAFTADFLNCEQTPPCNVFADWNMQIIDCQASFQAIIPALPPGYQLVGTEWTFGDGYSSSLPNPVHYYAAPGVYQVCLTTTIFNGSQCCTKTYCQNINIDKACDGGCDFDAQITWNVNPDECEFDFDLIVNFAGMPITNIFWDFGDGTYGTGVPITHTFPNPGSYTVCAYIFSTINGDCCFKKFCTQVDVECDPCASGDGTVNPTKQLQDISLSDKNIIVLNQNVPNPFAESTLISYDIPTAFTKAQIIFTNAEGKLIKAIDITKQGKGQVNVFADDLSTGIYVYTLVVDGKTIDSKRMMKN